MKTHWKLLFVENLVRSINLELVRISEEIQNCVDPDSYGFLDQFEETLGIGFTICQTFLCAVHEGKNKNTIISSGPYHSNGKSYAQITNACANYWKHKDEWDKLSISPQAKGTIEIIESLDVDVWSSYPLSQVFYLLMERKNNPSFDELLAYLGKWSSEVNA